MLISHWKGLIFLINTTKLSSLIEALMAYYHIPGMALGLVTPEGTEFFSFGERDKEKGLPFTEKTVSGIGSCSKSMTSFAVMRLAEKGILSIDTPIAEYIPHFALADPVASKAVTLRDMLCHRTGVGGHDGAWPDNSISRIEYLERLFYLAPNAPFRTLAQYSNVMYAAIGGIMEAVTAKKWEEILAEEIFAPLGMDHTYCLMGEAERETDCAFPYRWNHGLARLPRWNIDQAGPCGSVMSMAEDMGKWISCHIQGGRPLLSEESFREMHTPQILMDYPHVEGGRSLGYGLGWRVMDYHGTIVQQHTGKIEGYSAFQFYVPYLHCGAVYLLNLHCPDNPLIFAVEGFLLDAFLSREEEDWLSIYADRNRSCAEEISFHDLEYDLLPRTDAKGPLSHPCEEYEGIYENLGYGRFAVHVTEGRFTLDERAVSGLPMSHLYYDTFAVHGIKEDTDLYETPLTFYADHSGRIAGFHITLEPKVADIDFHKLQ